MIEKVEYEVRQFADKTYRNVKGKKRIIVQISIPLEQLRVLAKDKVSIPLGRFKIVVKKSQKQKRV